VLPVLPLVLSGSATGGRRRPFGIAVGLAITFTFTTLALAYVIDLLGLPDGLVRTLAIVVLIGFGLTLMVPPAAARFEAWLSQFTPQRKVDGFGSGVLLGGALGFLYAPCAGPILAAVLTVQASQELTAQRLTVGIAYGLGTAVGVLAISLVGRRLVPSAGRFQIAMGVVMVATAGLMLANVDTRFRTEIADKLPSFLVNPTGKIEEAAAKPHADLEELGTAPDFTGTQRWFNSEPLTIEGLRGKVVLVDFWTYTCINCLRTLPKVREWDARYRDAGLQVVGVHTPEFDFEKIASNVERAVKVNKIRYPVVQDNDFAVWNAYSNQYWPAKYLIDAEGRVRYAHFGEGDYDETEKAIKDLLEEAGRTGAPAAVPAAEAETADPSVSTPETYLGAERAQGFVVAPSVGSGNYGPVPDDLEQDFFSLGGRWDIGKESATAGAGASVSVRFGARRVFLVMGGDGDVEVLVDGNAVKTVRVRRQQLYRLVELPKAESHLLTLRFDRGVSAFAFTFG
jgi:cytochrome c biogenesis protein CcdA/thiol-disulfide isomerase/thioredoxin